jgi:drug/metabolite transporter (DMT)-like permease
VSRGSTNGPEASDAAVRALRPLLGPALLLVMGISWGGSFTLAKIATTAGGPPLGLALWEGLGSGALLWFGLAASGRGLRFETRHLRFYLVSGLLGVAVPAACLFFAARRLPVGVLSLVVTMVPILTYAVATLAAVERFVWLRAVGLVAGLGGALLVLLPATSLPEPAMAGWALLGFAGSALYALQNVYIAKSRPIDSDSYTLSCGTLLGGGVLLLPAVLATGSLITLLPPPLGPAWGAIEWSTVGLTLINAVCTILFFALIRFAGPVFASQVAYVVTLAGILWGIALFGERHSAWVWSAVGLLFLGIALVGLRGRRPA